MRRWYCEDCKEWFDEPNIVEWDEPRGEFWGMPCSEHMAECRCPHCNSDYVSEKHYDEEEE